MEEEMLHSINAMRTMEIIDINKSDSPYTAASAELLNYISNARAHVSVANIYLH